MKRPSPRRSPSHNLAIVLSFTVSAFAAACSVDTGELAPSGGAAGTGAVSGNGATAGTNASGGTTGGSGGTTGGSGGTTGGSGGATGGSGTGGAGGSGGSNVAGTGGMVSTGGSAGAGGSGGSDAAGGTGGVEVPDEPYCAVTEGWDPAYAALEEQILVLVNQYRAEGANCGGDEMPPVGPLTMDPSLQCAARVHTKDMADRDFFDHDNPDGDGPSERMEAAGYDGRGWGENIAAGRETAEETMEQWMDSPGHCTNIMDEDYTLIGVGYYPGGEYDHLWTQTFGS